MTLNRKLFLTWGILFAIIIAGFLLRAVNIENIPGGIYPDEAVNGMNAYDANQNNDYKLFYEDNNGREGLYINLQALSLKWFGNTLMGLKFWSIMFGTLTILGVFLLSKEIFRSNRAGLISAFLTAFSYWGINFSRIGFRAIMVPFILSFSFYFLLRGFRTRKYADFIIGGLIFGLGFHTYIAFRIAPAIILVLVVFALLIKKRFFHDYWKELLVFGAAAFITISPMIYNFYAHPEQLESRSSSISVFSPEMNNGNLIGTVARSVALSLVKYNFWGDQNWRHNYPPYPILNPIVGIAFLFGIIYVFYKSLHLFILRFRNGIRDRKLYIYIFLLAWFFGMLAPEFMTAEGLPHALRSIGTLPIVMIFATIPFLWILGKIKHASHGIRMMAFAVFTFVFLIIGIGNTTKYFYFFANHPMQHESFNTNLKQIAYHMRTLPNEKEKFIIAENMERIPIKFLNPKMDNVRYVYSSQIDSIQPQNSNFTILMSYHDQAMIEQLTNKFPFLSLINHTDDKGNKFYELTKTINN